MQKINARSIGICVSTSTRLPQPSGSSVVFRWRTPPRVKWLRPCWSLRLGATVSERTWKDMFCALNLSMWRTEVTVLRTWRSSNLRPSDGFSYQKEDRPQLTHPVTHPSKPASSARNAASSPKPTVSNPSAETAKILDKKRANIQHL